MNNETFPDLKNQEEFDFGSDADLQNLENNEKEDSLRKLSDLAKRQEEAEKDVAEKTLALSKAQAKLSDISEKLIPEIMESLKLGEISTEDGLKIIIKEKLRASIAQGDPVKQAEAFKWLEDHGHGHLIKREFKIEFGKDQTKWADKFERDLAKRKKPLNAKRKQSVHPGTLSALLAEELEKGVDVPLQTFNGFQQKYSKIERKK